MGLHLVCYRSSKTNCEYGSINCPQLYKEYQRCKDEWDQAVRDQDDYLKDVNEVHDGTLKRMMEIELEIQKIGAFI